MFSSRLGCGTNVVLQKVGSSIRIKAEFPGLRIHDLRHSFASEAINSGASLFLTGSVLGHRQASTTQRYAHLQSSPVRAVATNTDDRVGGSLCARMKSSLEIVLPGGVRVFRVCRAGSIGELFTGNVTALRHCAKRSGDLIVREKLTIRSKIYVKSDN